MALLERHEWYDIARATNWTPKYVTEDELFPDVMTGAQGVPMEKWEVYDEPYKTSYPGIRAHPAREGRRRLFGQGRARAQPHLRERRSGLALDPQGPLRRDRARRIRGDERGGAHVPLRPRAGHAQHGDLRHDGREPPRPDPALLPARILRRRTGSSTGRTRPTTPTNGPRSRRATPSTTCSWRAAPPRSRSC